MSVPAEVEFSFLDVEHWRQLLLESIVRRNAHLSQRALNEAVQRTIVRIVFLRLCEDRGIERCGRLQGLLDGAKIHMRLCRLFRAARTPYHSGLFRTPTEKDRGQRPDDCWLSPVIDDQPLAEIIASLYEPKSPRESSEMGTDILGRVYEQLLRKVIRLTPSRRTVVENEPERKKSGGVYYTPAYIVDYIVENTLGKLLTGKTPKQAAKLRVLDPACGSGSFLIGAYQYLLDWHRRWYVQQGPNPFPACKSPALYSVGGSGEDNCRLTAVKRKEILLNNIHGVDIDAQAVEVTKLSLLLLMFDDESGESLGRRRLGRQRPLPDLAGNIKCGNALIGPDFCEDGEPDRLVEESRSRIDAFDWSAEFPHVVRGKQNGGFDAVIGNPPYRRELDYKTLMDDIAATRFGKKYRRPRMDLWYYFVHRGLELLAPRGLLSFITNAYWMSGTGAEKLIAALQTETHVDEIFYFGKLKVFEGVAGRHLVFRLSREPSGAATRIKLAVAGEQATAEPFVAGRAAVREYHKSRQQLFREGKIDILPTSGSFLDRLACYPALETLGRVRQGIAENPASINRKTNARFSNRWKLNEGVFALRAEELERLHLDQYELRLLRPYYDLCDIGRYFLAEHSSLTLIYSTRRTCPRIDAFANLKAHLSRFRPIMEQRRETKNGSNAWWHLHWPRDETIWESPKLIVLQMAARPSCVPAVQRCCVPFSATVFVSESSTQEHLYYLAAILNSRVLWKWFEHHAKRRGIGLEINGNALRRSPIRLIDFSSEREKAVHDDLVRLVEKMLVLQQERSAARDTHEQTSLQRQAAAIDRRIDEAVYRLYGLTENEIRQVEEATR